MHVHLLRGARFPAVGLDGYGDVRPKRSPRRLSITHVGEEGPRITSSFVRVVAVMVALRRMLNSEATIG